MEETIKKIKDRLHKEFEDLKEGLKAAWQKMSAGVVFGSFVLLRNTLKGLIVSIEEIAHEIKLETGQDVTGAEKKRALKEWLHDVIDFKYVPDFIEHWAIDKVVDVAIDYLVKELNHMKGAEWYQDGIAEGRKYLDATKLALEE
jgi:hypothetical protein